MTVLLRITAAVAVVWSGVMLFALEGLAAAPVEPLLRTVAASLAAALLALAAAFVRASRAPSGDLFTVGLAIATVAARVVIDLWSLLGDLPPQPALYFLIDLVVAFALLVGLLEALPRTVAATRQADERA